MLKEDNFFNKQFHKFNSVITDNNDLNNSAFFMKLNNFLIKKSQMSEAKLKLNI